MLINEIGWYLEECLAIKLIQNQEKLRSCGDDRAGPNLALSGNRTLTIGCILGCLILSITIAMVPHLRTIESSEVIGVDTGYYSESIKNIVSKSNT